MADSSQLGLADSLAGRLHAVQQGISEAASAAGREPSEITLIVVTKFHPASLVRELSALGVVDAVSYTHLSSNVYVYTNFHLQVEV